MRIYCAQNETISAEVFDEDHGNFSLVINHRSSSALESGADLPAEAAPFDMKIYRSKAAAISRANAVTGNTASHGGAGRGQGRKPADGKRGTRRQVVLDDDSAAVLRAYGDGDLSVGIRRASVLVEEEVALRAVEGT